MAMAIRGLYHYSFFCRCFPATGVDVYLLAVGLTYEELVAFFTTSSAAATKISTLKSFVFNFLCHFMITKNQHRFDLY